MKRVLSCLLIASLLTACGWSWYVMNNWAVEGSFTKEGKTMTITAPTTLTFNESIKGIDFDDFEWQAQVNCGNDCVILLTFPATTQSPKGRRFLIVPDALSKEEFDVLNTFEALKLNLPTNKWMTIRVEIDGSDLSVGVSDSLIEPSILTVSEVALTTIEPSKTVKIEILRGNCKIQAIQIRS